MEECIIDKYKDFNVKEIQSGYRCKTYKINKNDEQYIYQVYSGDAKYQARKKKYFTNLIKSQVSMSEMPEIVDFGEYENFAYLVTEFKVGFELNEILYTNKFTINPFYNCLADILSKIHSIDVGTKFGWYGKDRLGRNKFFL
jgi:hypothetical protein